jgi:tetratricopeptide (TPR) repeat protein
MKLVNYKNKYIKYKSKYLENKNIIQEGGIDCNNNRVFKNILGTCWMIVIQMMICFGDVSKNDIENVLKINKSSIDSYLKELIKCKKNVLEQFFGKSFLEDEYKENLLLEILKTFYKRYSSKVVNIKEMLIKPIDKENPLRCELIINKDFKKLFTFYLEIKITNKSIDNFSGDLIEQFYFANILGIFFLNNKIYFKNFTRKNYNKINFNQTSDIGLIIKIQQHVSCCFICNNEYKFYNDNDRIIYDCDWYNLLLNLNENEDLFIVPSGMVKLDRNEYFENINNYYIDYIRVQYITIVSKNNFENELDKQISMYINGNYNKISDFFLLYEIYNKTNDDRYILYAAKEGYYFAEYILAKQINSYKILEKAVNDGSLEASYFLGLLYKRENKFDNAEKYLLIAYNNMFFYGNDTKKNNISKNLYEIYYNYYKNYKLALKFKIIFSESETINELKKIEDFNEKKILADEGFFDLQFDIGKNYFEKKDIVNAINYFNLARNSKQIILASNTAYELGKIYEKEDIDKAIDNYIFALHSPNIIISADASFILGQINYERKDLFNAIFYFKETIQKSINYINSNTTSHLKRTMDINIFNILGKAAIKLSEILINQEKEKDAIIYLKLASEKGSTEASLKLSEILIKQKKECEAISYLNFIVEKSSDKILIVEAALKLSEIFIKKDDKKAIYYFKLIVEKGSPKLSTEVAFKLGEIYYKNKNYEEAIKYFEIAVKSDEPEMAANLLSKIYLEYYKNYRLGWNYKLIVLPGHAIKIKKLEEFEQLKKLADNGYFDLQYEVGIKYLNDSNEIEAIKYFNKAIQTKQKKLSAKVSLKLGEILQKNGKKEDAICHLNFVKENGENNDKAYAYFKLGEIYEKEENIDEAYNNYIEINDLLASDINYNEILSLSNLKLGKIYFDKGIFVAAKHFLIDGINHNCTEEIILEYASILVEILKKGKKNYEDELKYLTTNINKSKINILLNKLDNIYKKN